MHEIMEIFSRADGPMNHSLATPREVRDRHLVIETLDVRIFPPPRTCPRWTLARGTAAIVRQQYTLRPAYAATSNGCQGATLKRCVVDLRRSLFSRGHLRVALGRAHDRAAARVFTTAARISADDVALQKNMVWPKLLVAENDDVVAAPRGLARKDLPPRA